MTLLPWLKTAGADVACRIAEVLGVVVVEGVAGVDPDQRQGLIVKYRGGVLRAVYPLFRKYLAAVSGRVLKRGWKLLRPVDLSEPEARAFGRWLDHQRQPHLFDRRRKVRRIMQHSEAGRI